MSGQQIQPIAARERAIDDFQDGAPPADWGGGQEAAPEPKGPSLARYVGAVNRFLFIKTFARLLDRDMADQMVMPPNAAGEQQVMKTKAVVAVARELTGFVWAIGQHVSTSGWQGVARPETPAA